MIIFFKAVIYFVRSLLQLAFSLRQIARERDNRAPIPETHRASPMSSQGEADDRELEAQRYIHTMPRRFYLWSLLSLGFTLTATWNAVGITIGTSLAESSSSGAVLTLVIAALMNLTVALGMAELASAYPNSGAQYYWSYKVASPEWAPFASYV